MNANRDHSDSQLVDLLITGDNTAFETIYRRYAADLYKYARRNISVKEDCEEIIQEVFESLWARHDKLQHVTAQEGYLKGYLINMVRYKIIRYFKNSEIKKRYAEHFRLFEAVYDNIMEEESEISTQAIINRGLAELPERCQMAVKLRLTENLSNSDIAKRMNIKKGTVENYMVTALSHLRASNQNLFKTMHIDV